MIFIQENLKHICEITQKIQNSEVQIINTIKSLESFQSQSLKKIEEMSLLLVKEITDLIPKETKNV